MRAARTTRGGCNRIEQSCGFVMKYSARGQVEHPTLIVRRGGCLAFEADGLLLGLAFERQLDELLNQLGVGKP